MTGFLTFKDIEWVVHSKIPIAVSEALKTYFKIYERHANNPLGICNSPSMNLGEWVTCLRRELAYNGIRQRGLWVDGKCHTLSHNLGTTISELLNKSYWERPGFLNKSGYFSLPLHIQYMVEQGVRMSGTKSKIDVNDSMNEISQTIKYMESILTETKSMAQASEDISSKMLEIDNELKAIRE